MSKKPVLLCIMDGFGWVPNETYGNAVVAAKTPHLDALMAKYPMTTIEASGMAVGLPDGQMGNSEVGHTNMGAGRIVYQQLTLITKSIRDGEMFKNPVLVKNMKAAIEAGKAIHLMGLVGTGGVHSHADHWFGVLEMAKHMGAKEVYLHCITDGRDTDPHAGKGFLADLQAKLDELGVGKIASVSGRYYAMDRDNNWDREEKAYAAFVYGEGNHAANAAEAIEASYAADKTDEFVLPCVTCEGGRVQDGDTVIFMNFRPDRARQMTRIFCDDDFKGFERRGGRKQVNYVCMAEYDATMPNCEVAYPPVELKNVLGQYLSENGKTQLRIAETEKYAHVTFFFNGGVEAPYEGEDRCVIPSPKVATYDLQPQMSAPEVAAECVKRIESGKYDVVILNFANCDMVGHTGVFDAAVKAVEAVDTAVDQVVTAVLNAGGCAFITADHGNAEKMMNPDGTPFTAHTTSVVPFVAVGCGDVKLREGGCLADIAPTMLPYIGLRVPAEVEIDGLDIHEHGLASAYAGFSISDANAAAMVPNENTDLGEDDASKASAVQMNAAVPVVKEPAVIHDGIYDTGMHKVSIIAKLSKFDQLKTALNDLGVTGMTVTQVMGCGIQKGTTEKYRGVPVDSTLLPKIKVEVIVSKISVDAVVDAAKKALYTGHIGDGKIFVYNVTRVVKIRTGEEDFAALQDVE